MRRSLFVLLLLSLISVILAARSNGSIRSIQKLSNFEGNVSFSLEENENFGTSVFGLGDLDLDGNLDIVVGAPRYNSKGAIYIVFLYSDGMVKNMVRIAEGEGGFDTLLEMNGRFGQSVTRIGDLDNDGVDEIAVGCSISQTVYVLFLNNTDWTVKYFRSISDSDFLHDILDDRFGLSVTPIGDVNGDNIPDIAVGAPRTNNVTGCVYIIFLRENGGLNGYVVIGENEITTLAENDYFGQSLTGLGDMDGDNSTYIAVGYLGGANGGIFIVKLNTEMGSYVSHFQFSSIFSVQRWSTSIGNAGDIDNDGIVDILVGDPAKPTTYKGSLYAVFLGSSTFVKDEIPITEYDNGFDVNLNDLDNFGESISLLGDLNNDGVYDYVVGAFGDNDGQDHSGAVYILFMEPIYTCFGVDSINDTSCDSRGICYGDDQCHCNNGFDGANCESCDIGFFGDDCQKCPSCVHGYCLTGINGTGVCLCTDGFSGTLCENCDYSSYGPACTECPVCVNGICRSGMDGDGKCICVTGYTGTSCNVSSVSVTVADGEEFVVEFSNGSAVTTIFGDFYLGTGSTLRIASSGKLVIEGCFLGSNNTLITYDASSISDTSEEAETHILVQYKSIGCANIEPDVVIEGLSECRNYTVDYGTETLAVIFSPDTCESFSWYVFFIPIGILVILITAFILLIIFNPTVKKTLFPYRNRRKTTN